MFVVVVVVFFLSFFRFLSVVTIIGNPDVCEEIQYEITLILIIPMLFSLYRIDFCLFLI